jgi:hypothetical protein
MLKSDTAIPDHTAIPTVFVNPELVRIGMQ